MKIVVRHEGATDQEVEQTCVWIVGDDGETVGTEYLKPGEQVDVDVSGTASIEASFCEVGPINAPAEEPPASDPPAPSGDQSASTSDGGGTSGDGASGETPSGAPGTPSGGEAGGQVAE
jgi:hypothetical protein